MTAGSPSSSRIVQEGDGTDGISDIVITINDLLRRASARKTVFGKSNRMCRAPSNLREIHKGDFDPKLVSVGPFHRHKPHLEFMEDNKLRFLSRLLGWRTEPSNAPAAGAVTIEDLVGAMKELEVEARDCYLETFHKIGTIEFIQMMIIDGCFVMELMHLNAKFEEEKVEDPIFDMRWTLPYLRHDLLLLENQLPFPVLEKIFELTRASRDGRYTLVGLALKFFDPIMPRQRKLEVCESCVESNPDHLLQLFRSSFISAFQYNNNNIDQPIQALQVICSVTELNDAGGKFQKRSSGGDYDLLNIRFQDGALEVPPLLVDVKTGQVLLNILAYEQCNRLEPYFTKYVMLFAVLISSPKDVEILQAKGIIKHKLDCDEDVADLFKKLCKDVAVEQFEPHNCYLYEPLKNFSSTIHFTKWSIWKKRWNRWKKQWREDYFSNPWTFSSFLAAIIFLILTALQTFFSIFSYVLPPS